VDLSAHGYSFYIPGSAFAALTAAGLPTNLPLAGQSIQVRWWQSPCGFSGLPFRQRVVVCVWGPETIVLRRLAPAIQKMFVFQTKFDHMVEWWKLYASNLSRCVGGNRHEGAVYVWELGSA
jgi:hypothetical protein